MSHSSESEASGAGSDGPAGPVGSNRPGGPDPSRVSRRVTNLSTALAAAIGSIVGIQQFLAGSHKRQLIGAALVVAGSCQRSSSTWTCTLYRDESVLFNGGDPRHQNSQGGDVVFKPEDGLLIYTNHAHPSQATVAACQAAQGTLYPSAPVDEFSPGDVACRLESSGTFHDVSFVQIVDVSKAQSQTRPAITVKVWFQPPS